MLRQLQFIKGFWTLKPPKYNSVKDIDLSNKMIELLKREKEKQDDNKLKYGVYYKELKVNDNGADLKYVQMRLGHKSIKVTLEIYYQLTDEIRENDQKYIEML